MNTHHEIPLNDPALGAIDVRETSASSLIQPLFENDSASIVANAHSIVLDGEHYELPKLLLLGERGGGVPIRVGIFAGLDAGRVETVPAPGALGITSVEMVNGTTARINTPATGGAEGATEIVVQWKLSSETTWGNEVDLTRPTQTISDRDFEQATVDFRIVTRNSGGSTASDVVSLSL